MLAEDEIKNRVIQLTSDLPDIETPYTIWVDGVTNTVRADELGTVLERVRMRSVSWQSELTTRLEALDDVLRQADSLDVETAATLRAYAVSFAGRVEKRLETMRAECRFPLQDDRILDRSADTKTPVPAEVRRSKVRINQLHLHYRKICIAASDSVGRFLSQHGNHTQIGCREPICRE